MTKQKGAPRGRGKGDATSGLVGRWKLGAERPLTHMAFVRDGSDSMRVILQPAIEAYTRQVEQLKRDAIETGNDVTITDVWFAERGSERTMARAVLLHDFVVPAWPLGSRTALHDAFLLAVRELESIPVGARQPSYLVRVWTDGEENDSRAAGNQARWLGYGTRDCSEVRSAVRRLHATGRWTFVFEVPRGQRAVVADQFGVSIENVIEWDQTEAGTADVALHTQSAFTGYLRARSTGAKALDNFYQRTDLSQVTDAKIKRELEPLGDHVKVYDVPAEQRIDSFVEKKTRRPYVTGQGYYQLVKPELVQGHKEVLIQKIDQREVWGGDAARELVGLQPNQTARVRPGNHADYIVYVQSTAPNRILPRGSKIAIDFNRTTPVRPTWQA